MTTRIRRYVETDTGHRVPNHKSKCRHFHGHRYRFEAEIEGDIVETTGVSEEGMLMDFSDVSHILTVHIHDVVDHAFVVYEGDEEARNVLSGLSSEHRTVVVPFIPTAENLQNGRSNKCNHTFKLRTEIDYDWSLCTSEKPRKVGPRGTHNHSSSRSLVGAESISNHYFSLQIQEQLMHRRNLLSIGLFDPFQVQTVAMRELANV